ncbi:MAG: hypothetical protein OXL96_03850 [Candidatus Poribacteria bacterium]|nr:hypothetical protein [Candidatus Poribacteria bacterium]
MKSEINAWDGNQLLNTSVDDLCKYFVQRYSVDIPILNRNEIKKDYEDTRVDISRDPKYTTDDQSGPVYVQGVRIEISVPYTGERDAFWWHPTTHTLNPPRAFVSNIEEHLTLVITGTNLEPDIVLQEINDTLDKIDDYLTSLREDADKLNGNLDSIARQYIEVRRAELLKNRNLFEALPFKLKQRKDSAKTYTAPEVRQRLIPTPPEASSQPYQPEPALDQENYEHILEVIENMTQVMELSPSAFSEMDEEALRSHFLVQLNGHYEGQVTGETFNYEGKTDILIRSEGKNIFIAECKYWNGSQKLTKTIDQLLGYSSWRDTKVAVIVFNRNKNFTRVLDSIKSTTKEHPNCKRELNRRSETSFRFVFSHRDDVNREMTLTVMAFDVPK